MIEKEGKLFCRTFLDWVRRQRCIACIAEDASAAAGSDAHHIDGKGMGGARLRDDRTIPLCRKHHDQAQRYEISADTQMAWVHHTRSRFLEECTPEELQAFTKDLLAWKERPLAYAW